MTTKKVVKNVAKGLALGILWPAAVGYVAGKRVNEFLSNISHESLAMARGWTESGNVGTKAWSNRIPITIEQPVARSLGAAARNPRVNGKKRWLAEKFEAVWQRVKGNYAAYKWWLPTAALLIGLSVGIYSYSSYNLLKTAVVAVIGFVTICEATAAYKYILRHAGDILAWTKESWSRITKAIDQYCDVELQRKPNRSVGMHPTM